MRNQSRALCAGIAIAGMALAVGVGTNAGAEAGKKPAKYGGKLVSIDKDAKTMVVKGREGEQTIKYTDKTQVDIRVNMGVKELPVDHFAHVSGKLDEETGAIEARSIILPPRRHKKYEAVRKTGVTGALMWEGDQLYVKAKGKRFKVDMAKNGYCQTTEEIGVSDLEPGDGVAGDGKMTDDGLVAHRIIVSPRKKK